MKLRTLSHPRIVTKDEKGSENGFLIPIYNVYDNFVDASHHPQQVYLTVCAPGTRKGPHLHLKRWGYFTCIKGNVRIIARTSDGYQVEYSGEAHEFRTIEIPAGVPALIECVGDEDAYVINTPSPAWRADDMDEHPVADWHNDAI
jgi:dTDP-4-dehydrorhamnose 3,5-epimerase-like enzyme